MYEVPSSPSKELPAYCGSVTLMAGLWEPGVLIRSVHKLGKTPEAWTGESLGDPCHAEWPQRAELSSDCSTFPVKEPHSDFVTAGMPEMVPTSTGALELRQRAELTSDKDMYLDNSSIEEASGVYPIDDDDYASASGSEPMSHNYRARVLQLLKPVRLEPVLCSNRSHRNEKPAYRNEE
ncbi:hypothetical protein J1605_007728 [Eschrichtius robustus]|uniref:Uncharacterized protein n=1 Tax=Eschrichtius robustus TaxID=9764 RepID=A0AB34H028_ESCRO|nr:hypothetical protein J1605_011397 [Eschrichtius robustus]KAJ8784828.1 hypothetical protein J1605_007855 [Eschrichtius robustus]KAJ8785172.1 hypothetical protein J1605_007728 [Eschrichtius robustus]